MPRKDAILKIRISEILKAEVDRIASETGETAAVIVRQALREYLDRRKSTTEQRTADYLKIEMPEAPLVAEEPGNHQRPPSASPVKDGATPLPDSGEGAA